MTAFSAIDLEKLPSPDVIETIDFETILSEMVADFKLAAPDIDIDLESDPTYKIFEISAYRELILRARINDAARAVMLAYAENNDLDHIGALFEVERQVVVEGDDSVTPPIDPVLETDSRFRSRIQLSFEGISTAGPVGSYLFHTLNADSRVKDVDVSSPSPGDVVVTVLSSEDQGIPSEAVLTAVELVLNSESIRPLTDHVTVVEPDIINYAIEAELILFEGPDSEVVRLLAQSKSEEYASDRHRLGHDITLSGVYAALHQPGVQKVI